MTEICWKAFAAKPVQRKYEQEKRLLIRSKSPGDTSELFSFPSDAVKEIIIGERMPESYLTRS